MDHPAHNTMNWKSALLLGLTAMLALLMSGCTEKSPYDTAVPWSRPADWENQVPGMGQ